MSGASGGFELDWIVSGVEGKCPGRSYCIRGVSGVLLVHQSLLDSLESTEDHQTDSKLHS